MMHEQAEQFFVDNEKLLWYIINRYRVPYEPLIDDYEGTVSELFWKYVLQADPDNNTKAYIRKSIYLMLKRLAMYGYRQATSESIQSYAPGKSFDYIPYISVDDMLACLNDQELLVAERLDAGYTLREIAQDMGLSHQRVHQIRNKIREKFKKFGFYDIYY